MMIRTRQTWLALALISGVAAAQEPPSRKEVVQGMRRAGEFFRTHVASHGGYVYHYSLDLTQRWGEGVATKDQIWVQPPGTPTVGLAFLRAYQATGDSFFLDAATDAAMALVDGQLKSGGWTAAIDFDPAGSRVAQYRRGGRGKNNSSLDDGQTQSAIRLLVRVDRAHDFRLQPVHEAAVIALDALLLAQFPNGGFPQVWTGPVEDRPVLKANLPDYDWRTEGRIKNYWDMYTLNDNVPGYIAEALIDAYEVYDDERFLRSLRRLGDFLLLAQMPEPQPGWAQQYNPQMQPIWARKFEPPAVAGDETQETIETLVRIAHVTKDRKYLTPIPAAAAWLQRSLLDDGRLARYYELQTNRPLFMIRRGDQYLLTYDDSNLPSHYGWKTQAKLSELGEQYARVREGKLPRPRASAKSLAQRARNALDTLDEQGRWISTFRGERLIGQLKLPSGAKYLSSRLFSDNLVALAEYLDP